MGNPVENFKVIFNKLDKDNLHLVGELYSDDVLFRDPIHEVHGIKDLNDYFARLYDGVDSCKFKFESEVIGDGEAMLTWKMRLVHGSFRAGIPVVVPGASHIRFNETKVTYHQDYFDVGKLIYERIPYLGAVIRKIKGRL